MNYTTLLTLAQTFACSHSGCEKVKVGCVLQLFVKTGGFDLVMGANVVPGRTCLLQGCNRKRVHGDDSKEHRGDGTCLAIHSEINALSKVFSVGRYSGGVALITRYPCEDCARAIAESGVIQTVVYGRKPAMSSAAADLLETAHINVIHMEEWGDDANDR